MVTISPGVACPMNRPREQVFARSRLPREEDGMGAERHCFHVLEEGEHAGVPGDDLVEDLGVFQGAGEQVAGQGGIFQAQLLDFRSCARWR